MYFEIASILSGDVGQCLVNTYYEAGPTARLSKFSGPRVLIH